jgi:protein-disulfide isomerase
MAHGREHAPGFRIYPLVVALLLSPAAELVGSPASGTASAAATASPAVADTINLREIGFALGPEGAPVTVVEFSDFGCPFCAMFGRGTFPELYREFVEPGQVRWVFVPFHLGQFSNSPEATRAAQCAAQQGRFFHMKERIYAGQREWKAERRPAALFEAYAADAGLDVPTYTACYGRDDGRARTRAANRAANLLGVRGTPTFFINGERLVGAPPPEQFRAILMRLVAGAQD